uniref:Uncharacterized protein n=1 Tax=Timema bartmani TaxID=61472 RepID=A0A7R9EQM9_9NEOP|nr:unnamed protein product [Timema bartmani]
MAILSELPKCEKNSLDSVPYFYIDVFNRGKFLNLRSCPRFSTGSQCPMQKKSKPAATTLEVVERLANNLEVACRQRTLNRNARLRNALELIHLVNPRDIHCLLKLARLYMLSNMDIKDLMICLTALYNPLYPAALFPSTGAGEKLAIVSNSNEPDLASLEVPKDGSSAQAQMREHENFPPAT